MFLFRDALPNLQGKARFFHAAAGAEAVDIYSDGSHLATNLDFGEVTPYKDIKPGKHKIEIFKASTKSTPLYTDTIEIIPNEIVTLSAVLLESTLTLFTLKDNPPKNVNELTFLRFINFSPDAPLLSLSLPDSEDTLFNGVEYLETTGFYPLSGGLYNFLVTATTDSSYRKFINSVQLNPNSSHTIFVIGLAAGSPELGYVLTEDGYNNQKTTIEEEKPFTNQQNIDL